MRNYILPMLLILLAAGLQGNLPEWMLIKGGQPDLILVALIATALMLDPTTGAVLGFFAGLVQGSIVSDSLGSFIVTRTIIGYAAGTLTVRMFSDNPVVPVIAAGGLTFVGEFIFLLANPTPNLIGAINTILAKSLYDSLLTIIVFWFLRWMEVRRKIKMASARL